MSEQLTPCPFCGGSDTLDVISGNELMGEEQEFWQHRDSFAVVCDASTPDGKGGCGACGGFMPTKEVAINAWNRRAPSRAEDSREAFEAWFSDGKPECRGIERTGDGYRLMQAHEAWRVWQAASAHLNTEK